MNVSINWLREYVKMNASPDQLAEKFRMTSSEVESLTNWSEKFEHVVVGRVLTVKPHPDADRLRVTTVDVGNDQRTIVCGAPNVAEGQYVLVALPGAKVTSMKGESIVIANTTIRGVHSQGMICACEELGLPALNDGIFVLPEAKTPGTPAAEALMFDDTVLDVEITPNRPDLLSYFGLAREVAAFEKKRLLEPSIASLESQKTKGVHLSVHVESSKVCPRYTALCIEGVRADPSPWWLQSRLILSGVRPINIIVDVTNYVMLELGQPLHAFDLDRLPVDSKGGYQLWVRTALKEETLTLLDNSIRTLTRDDIVIADTENRAIALAGVMGGSSSAINPGTTRIIVESATFNAPQVRRTSMRLGLRSEASSRFEKGLDPELTVTALKRVAFLLQEICDAKVASPVVDVYTRSRAERPRIELSFDRIQQVLGVHISAQEAKSILQQLGFQIPQLTKSGFETVPPSWRKDVTLPEDVIEELIRLWGYERIPSTLPGGVVKPPQSNLHFEMLQKIRAVTAAEGLFESIHLPFISETALKQVHLNPKDVLRIPNPLSAETEYLIPSHIASFLHTIARVNLDREEIGLYEIGRVFSSTIDEHEHFSILLRTGGSAETLYRRIKTVLQSVSSILPEHGTFTYQAVKTVPEYIQPGSGLSVHYNGKAVGQLGLVAPSVLENLKIRRAKQLLFMELHTEKLLSENVTYPVYVPAPQFPSIERDITAILPRSVSIAELTSTLEKGINKELTLEWRIADIYTGRPLAEDKKAVTLHFVYNGRTRTLEDAEASRDQSRLVKLLRSELTATINE